MILICMNKIVCSMLIFLMPCECDWITMYESLKIIITLYDMKLIYMPKPQYTGIHNERIPCLTEGFLAPEGS